MLTVIFQKVKFVVTFSPSSPVYLQHSALTPSECSMGLHPSHWFVLNMVKEHTLIFTHQLINHVSEPTTWDSPTQWQDAMSYCVFMGVSSRFFIGVSNSFIGESIKFCRRCSFLGVESGGFFLATAAGAAADDSTPDRSVLVDRIVTGPEDSTLTLFKELTTSDFFSNTGDSWYCLRLCSMEAKMFPCPCLRSHRDGWFSCLTCTPPMPASCICNCCSCCCCCCEQGSSNLGPFSIFTALRPCLGSLVLWRGWEGPWRSFLCNRCIRRAAWGPTGAGGSRGPLWNWVHGIFSCCSASWYICVDTCWFNAPRGKWGCECVEVWEKSAWLGWWLWLLGRCGWNCLRLLLPEFGGNCLWSCCSCCISVVLL